MKRYYIDILLMWMLALTSGIVMQGCRDDAFDEFNVQFPDGVTDLNIDLNFEPIASNSLQGRAGNAPAGDVIKNLNDLSILFYDTRVTDGTQLMRVEHYVQGEDSWNRLTISTVPRGDTDASTGITAEKETQHVTTTIKSMPFAAYKIIAVANLKGGTRDVLEANDISTPEKLLDLKAEWDSGNMLNNSQMFGYFTADVQHPSPGTGSGGVPEVAVNRPNMTLHSWIRRLASKITIDYDATRLRRGITVTIKKVTVRDIASTCFLGGPNKVGDTETSGRVNTDPLINDGTNHCIEYDQPIVLTNATAGYPRKDPSAPDYPHSETAPALFFFENMQGEVPDKDANGKLQDGKFQDGDGDGIVDYPGANNPESPDYIDNKDGLKYGTYIEVEAEYDARTINNIGRGTIKYRFMIGKNVTTNCDAERNHHYKLTMRFMGNANEVDWHIDYDEEPGFYGPNPYFVSYSYNQMTSYPIKISGKVDGDVTMTIIQNAWWPNNAKAFDYYAKEPGLKHITDDGKVVNDSAGVDMTKLYTPDKVYPLQPWTGFLSLAQDMTRINTSVAPGLPVVGTQANTATQEYLYKYWMGTNDPASLTQTVNDTKMARGTRSYKTAVGTHGSVAEGGTYRVVKDETSTTIYVPFYTREKQLQSTTAYTGNNPFVSYQREAKVEIKYRLEGDPAGEYRRDTIRVYQVRRVVNPKGVWRSHNCTDEFHVVLNYQDGESNPQFKDLTSVGPWRASVVAGNTGFIRLNGMSQVRGADGSKIDFTITFAGRIAATENRCAVIRIEYNNYSCHHLIFVRQGEAPIRMNTESQLKWHTANVATTTGDASDLTVGEGVSPLDEGGLFRYGNLTCGVAARSNPIYQGEINGTPLIPTVFYPTGGLSNPKFDYLTDGTAGNWNDSKLKSAANSSQFPDVKIKGGNNAAAYSVATGEDFATLISAGDKYRSMEQGYGVLYGDGTTETANDVEHAYGYCADAGKTAGYGMRGVFVYNSSASVAEFGGNNLFFPIGQAGYGRRRNFGTGWGNIPSGYDGILHYASRTDWYPSADLKYLPLFYDIFRSHGAIYWMKKASFNDGGSTVSSILDINYHTLDFNTKGDQGFHGGGYPTDAGFVRLVEK